MIFMAMMIQLENQDLTKMDNIDHTEKEMVSY